MRVPAAIVAAIVFFVTFSLWRTEVAFLAVTLVTILSQNYIKISGAPGTAAVPGELA